MEYREGISHFLHARAITVTIHDQTGHGEHGDVVSHFVMNELQATLATHPSLLDDPSKALKESYVKVDEALQKSKVRRAEACSA